MARDNSLKLMVDFEKTPLLDHPREEGADPLRSGERIGPIAADIHALLAKPDAPTPSPQLQIEPPSMSGQVERPSEKVVASISIRIEKVELEQGPKRVQKRTEEARKAHAHERSLEFNAQHSRTGKKRKKRREAWSVISFTSTCTYFLFLGLAGRLIYQNFYPMIHVSWAVHWLRQVIASFLSF